MFYFSELKNKKVYTEDKIEVGILHDIIFEVSDNPQVTKLVIRNQSDQKLLVPIKHVSKINSYFIISKAYTTSELQENEMYVMKNLLDKQIIDIVGNKIVRVNDVVIQKKILINSYEMSITGVDIGLLAIFRWINLEKIIIKLHNLVGIKVVPKFLAWSDIQPLELVRGKVKLRKEEEKLEKMRPEDLADYLEKTNELNVRKFLKILDKKFAAKVVSNLNINYQKNLFQHWSPEKAAKILSLIDDAESIDILLTLSRKKRYEIIHLLSNEKKEEILKLLHLSKTSIGNRITTEYLTVSPTNTVKEVMDLIKTETSDYLVFTCIYVINEKQELIGVFSPHELLMHDLDIPIYKFMVQNLIEVRLSTPLEIVLKKMLKYRLLSIPVVDNNKYLLGIVTFDEITDIIEKKLK